MDRKGQHKRNGESKYEGRGLHKLTVIPMANIPAEVFHTLEVGFQPAKYAKEIVMWVAILVAVVGILIFISRHLAPRIEGVVE
jgi:hypothetical protein